jgi:inhibitor of cysteine peptidase
MLLKSRLLRYYLLLVLVVIFIAGHALALELTGSDCGRSVTLQSDEELVVVLAGNPSTGFLWEVTGLDESVLKQEGGASFHVNSNLAGAGGMLTFRFLPCRSGSTRLLLTYRRPWEHQVPPVATFEVVVNVLAAGAGIHPHAPKP